MFVSFLGAQTATKGLGIELHQDATNQPSTGNIEMEFGLFEYIWIKCHRQRPWLPMNLGFLEAPWTLSESQPVVTYVA